MTKFAIVIPCYNRLDTLKVLLDSLMRAHYGDNVSLVFSIDNSGSDAIFNFATDFQWKYGEKIIIHHSENIGLKRNLLSCGDLTDRFDAVIVLEDDLLVSPSFFDYACAAYDYYKTNDQIAGISLFSYKESENLHTFNPLTYGYDTYFVQWTSSWGQLWTKNQWDLFKKWYNYHSEDISSIPIPNFVKMWNNSWKKYHIAYLVETNRYFVYPIVSYTSVQPALGVHIAEVRLDRDNIVPLCSGIRREFMFQKLDNAIKYDCFFEIKSLMINLKGEDIIADLNIYGDKNKENIINEYFVSTKQIPNATSLRSWGIVSLPFEDNIINSIEGEDLFLYKSKDFVHIDLTPSEKVAYRIKLTIKERFLYYIKRAFLLLKK